MEAVHPSAGRTLVPADYQAGDRVAITFGLFRERTGTIGGHTRWPWRDTWFVDLDAPRLGFRRLRVAERALRHLPPS